MATVRRAPLRNEDGEIVKWYGVMVDIEEQKAAENGLRPRETNKERTIGHAPSTSAVPPLCGGRIEVDRSG